MNDVVLAICGGALRRYLQEKGQLPDKPLVAGVPISLREPGDTRQNNQVSGMLCQIATDIAGNVGQPVSISFTLDTRAPQITLTSLADNDAIYHLFTGCHAAN